MSNDIQEIREAVTATKTDVKWIKDWMVQKDTQKDIQDGRITRLERNQWYTMGFSSAIAAIISWFNPK